MRKVIVLLASLLFITVSVASVAAPAKNGGVKVGVLDVGKVLQESPQVKAAVDKLKAKFKARQDKIAASQKTLADNEAKLKRDRAVLKQSELDDLQMKIMDGRRQLKNMQEEYMQAARLAQNQVMRATLKKVDSIVKSIAAKEHYDLILQRDNVAYASSKINITPEVIKRLKNK